MSIADTKKFINIYEASKTAQAHVKEFEASELVAYDESLTEQSSTVIVTRSIQGELAEAVRTMLKASETVQVLITLIDKRTWDNGNESWQDEVTLRVEVGETSQVVVGTSYYGALVELLEWLPIS